MDEPKFVKANLGDLPLLYQIKYKIVKTYLKMNYSDVKKKAGGMFATPDTVKEKIDQLLDEVIIQHGWEVKELLQNIIDSYQEVVDSISK